MVLKKKNFFKPKKFSKHLKGVFAKNERGYRLNARRQKSAFQTIKQIIQILQPIVIDYLSPHLYIYLIFHTSFDFGF